MSPRYDKNYDRNFRREEQSTSEFEWQIFGKMKDGGIIASSLPSQLSKIINPEQTSFIKPVKDLDSKKIIYLLMKETIPETLNKKLSFRDTEKKLEMEEVLLNMIINKNCNVDLAKIKDEKLLFEFAKEMYFDEKASGNKRTRDKALIKLFKSSGIMAGSLKKSKPKSGSTSFLSPNPNDLL